MKKSCAAAIATAFLLSSGCSTSTNSTGFLAGGLVFATIEQRTSCSAQQLLNADGTPVAGRHTVHQYTVSVVGLGPDAQGVALGETRVLTAIDDASPPFFERWSAGKVLGYESTFFVNEAVDEARERLVGACPEFAGATDFSEPLLRYEVAVRLDRELAVVALMEPGDLEPLEDRTSPTDDLEIAWLEGFELPEP